MKSSTSNLKQIPFKTQPYLFIRVAVLSSWHRTLPYCLQLHGQFISIIWSKVTSHMIKKCHEMYCHEHSYFVLKCSYACQPTELNILHSSRARPTLCCYSCLCVKNWSTHVLLHHCWTQQMVYAELQQMGLLFSDDTLSYGASYSLCLVSLYLNRYINK